MNHVECRLIISETRLTLTLEGLKPESH